MDRLHAEPHSFLLSAPGKRIETVANQRMSLLQRHRRHAQPAAYYAQNAGIQFCRRLDKHQIAAVYGYTIRVGEIPDAVELRDAKPVIRQTASQRRHAHLLDRGTAQPDSGKTCLGS